LLRWSYPNEKLALRRQLRSGKPSLLGGSDDPLEVALKDK